MPVNGSAKFYVVALSFAGEQREYVGSVASHLRGHGIGVFYDAYERARLTGANLETELTRIYGSEATCTVLFLSQEYKAKTWTQLEMRCAVAAHKESNV